MNERMKKVLAAYKAQTAQVFNSYGPSYSQMYQNMNAAVLFDDYNTSLKHDTGVGAVNELDLWFADDGLFADCCLDNPVMSLLARPIKSVAMLFPVVADNTTVITRSALVGNYDLDGTRPINVCEPGPNAGEFGNCVLEFRKGRISMSSRTAELDALIESGCSGTNAQDFYIVGGQRGVSGRMSPFGADDTNRIFSSAIYRELHTISVRMHNDLAKMFWSGDPANNTAGGGYKEFRGILNYIVDDYTADGAGKDWVTSNGDVEACDILNSDIKEFNSCVGAVNADGHTLFQLLEELEYELDTRASVYSQAVEWVLVMPSIIARAIYRMLPCEMVNGTCGAGSTNVDLVANDSFLLEARRQLQNNQMITLNGRNYRIVEDDFLDVVETVNGPTDVQYTSDIIFLPVRIGGQPAIEWTHKDYRTFANELGALGSLADELRGWSDNGLYHTVLQRDLRCFIVDVKVEHGLVTNAAFSTFAGKVTGISACTLQAHTTPNLLD